MDTYLVISQQSSEPIQSKYKHKNDLSRVDREVLDLIVKACKLYVAPTQAQIARLSRTRSFTRQQINHHILRLVTKGYIRLRPMAVLRLANGEMVR